MKKSEYIGRLSAALRSVEKSERDKYIAYYSELIDDRMEEGLDEESAVAGLEEVNAAAHRILIEAREQGKIKQGLSPGAIVGIVLGSILLLCVITFTLLGLTGYSLFNSVRHVGDTVTPYDMDIPPSGEYELHELSFENGGQRFSFELIVSHIEIRPSNDDDFHLSFYVGEDHPLELSEGSAFVTLEDPRNNLYSDIELSNLFSLRSQRRPEYVVTLLVPKDATGRLDLASVSGDTQIIGISVENDLGIANVSGNITIDNLNCQKLSIATVSGDTEFKSVDCGSIDIAATSGDIDFESVDTGTINAANVSGTFELSGTSFTSLYCNTVSGNLNGSLLGRPDDYRVTFASLSGRNSLSGITGKGSIFIEFASVSGDLNLEFDD